MIHKAIRGTKDIYGESIDKFDYIIKQAEETFKDKGYRHIITPTFEHTSLFQRGIGEGTDIVEKEMYTFYDRGDRQITLRPEGTASIVRSYIENNFFATEEISKFYYYGPMFRYERPQTGRYREFYQVGLECMGSNSYILDAEVIYTAFSFLKKCNIIDIEILINSVGCPKCRTKYREVLKSYIKERLDNLCNDCKVRYEKNPLRVLDCKVDSCKKEMKEAPNLLEYLCDDCNTHFEGVKKYLDMFEVPYKVDNRLVRGLDYYTNTVFEIVTDRLGAQGTILAGGRYNNLIEEIGGKSVPAIGFAAGVERVSMLLENFDNDNRFDIYVAWMDEDVKEYTFNIINKLRQNNIKVTFEYEKKSVKAQMKKAAINSKNVIIIGSEEKESGLLALKDLDKREQEKLTINEIINKFTR